MYVAFRSHLRPAPSHCHPPAVLHRQKFLMRLAKALMTFGAPSHRIESQLRQSLRTAAETNGSASPSVDATAHASVLTAFAVGRLQRYARSGFKRPPTEYLDAALQMMVG